MEAPDSMEEPLDIEDDPSSSSAVWHALETSEIFTNLDTSPEDGLSSDQARARLEKFGPNELAEAQRPGLYRLILDQFNNFIVILLILASIVSALFGDYVEAAAILAIVLLNATFGVIQERRAEQELEALRKLSAPEAHLIRDGHRQSLPARDLVPGDLVLLEAGNYVPADLRLVETANLRILESALTGESAPVEKEAEVVLRQAVALGDRANTAFSGTLISYGRGKGVVVSTGMNTQIGLIATMIQSVKLEPTPLQLRLNQLGRVLGWAALAICALVFALGWWRGYEVIDSFLVAVSLAVAAVPEGLPAVVTITLALGMQELIKRNALIRRLSSVETLGSTTVICSDKTGTLTQNQMSVTQWWVDGVTFTVSGTEQQPGFLVEGKPVALEDFPAATTALWVGALDNDAALEITPDGNGATVFQVVGDPTEVALINAAIRSGARIDELYDAYPRIDEIPFDSTRKRMTTVHKVHAPRPEDASPFYNSDLREWEVAATKGAPDVVLDLCTHYQTIDDQQAPLTPDKRRQILQANEAMASQALRVIGVSYRVEQEVPQGVPPDHVEHDLIFVGLIGMIDPPRPEVGQAIQSAETAGIRTVMITGDYPDTARAIAEDIMLLNPEHELLSGRQLDEMTEDQLAEHVKIADVYARVTPEHKLRIVEALKLNQQIVAMTGDGVNDAPALTRADIGVAMGIAGTDVAKEASDMVLTDDNYASIVAAVEQGRVIYANIRKFVFYLISCNLAEIFTIFLAILAGLPSPLTAIQLLWLNLITDGAPALALGMEKGDPDTMQRPPRPANEPIINREMRIQIGLQTVAITAVTLTAFLTGLRLYPEIPLAAGTMAFATLSFSELLRAFTSRSERYPLFKIGILSNRYMIYAVISSALLLLGVIYLPFLQPIFDTTALSLDQWGILLPLLVVPAVVAEISKWAIHRWSTRSSAPENC
jgi:Ca2+-transporting ATPase